ncbi:hypothetical protein ASZ90_018567 [hydrocarbon metagenome]|uniref:Uncharacterized protein n=1 Tax=hydrocarbon metagenome TaxID=938273 RepID=A0A0W8E6G9_9ZZZZ
MQNIEIKLLKCSQEWKGIKSAQDINAILSGHLVYENIKSSGAS